MSGYVLTDTERERLRAQLRRMESLMAEHEEKPLPFFKVMALGDELAAIIDTIGVPEPAYDVDDEDQQDDPGWEAPPDAAIGGAEG
jgi:hypothetical protein